MSGLRALFHPACAISAAAPRRCRPAAPRAVPDGRAPRGVRIEVERLAVAARGVRSCRRHRARARAGRTLPPRARAGADARSQQARLRRNSPCRRAGGLVEAGVAGVRRRSAGPAGAAAGLARWSPTPRERARQSGRAVRARVGRTRPCSASSRARRRPVAKRKRQRQRRRLEAVPEQQAGLGRADEQRARPASADAAARRSRDPAWRDRSRSAGCGRTRHRRGRALAENRPQTVALPEVHLPAHRVAQTMPERRGFEVTVAERQLAAAKRIPAVDGAPAPAQ